MDTLSANIVTNAYQFENILLLHVCRNMLADVSVNEPPSFVPDKDIDWNYVVRRAYQHGIAPLVYYGIQRFRDAFSIPLTVLEKFKKSCITTQLVNQRLLATYKKLSTAFQEEQIPVIPYKGIALIRRIYAGIDQRPMSDIDLLVKKEDVSKASRILECMGFHVVPYNILFKNRHFHMTFLQQNARNSIVVELHWHVDFAGSPYALRIDDVWSRAHQNDNSLIYIPEIHDDILLNIYHLFRDPTQDKVIPLKNCVDIAMLLQKYRAVIYWNTLCERAQSYGLYRLLSLGMALLYRLQFIDKYESAESLGALWCVPPELVDGIIQEKIFQEMEKEPYLPDGLLILPRKKNFFYLDMKTIFNTVTYHLVNEYINRKSLVSYFKKITAKFFSAFKNYCLVVWIFLRERHQFQRIVEKKIRKTTRLQHIENWLRGE